jgi:hypothetical protein
MPAKRIYLPPFAVILGLLGRSRSSPPIADDQTVTLPFGVLRLLLRGALASAPFHEEHYLHLYADVAAAVFRGEIRNGREHFVTNGYFEGREGCSEDFAESWYLSANADVALAVRAGTFDSARDHYIQSGMFELRGPNPAVDNDLAPWRACCPAVVERDPVGPT